MIPLKEFIGVIGLIFLSIACGSTPDSNQSVSVPELISDIAPEYPETASLQNAQGKVELFFLIDSTGNVVKTNVVKSSGYPELDSSALSYSRVLKFRPAVKNDEPVPVWIKWSVVYRLEEVGESDYGTSDLNVMVFTKANDFAHESRAAGKKALKTLADEYNFNVYFTEDSLDFNLKFLTGFDVVVWLNTSGNVLGLEEEKAFEKYIENGGGYVGVHGASDTEYDWDWYGSLLGTFFDEHPEKQTAALNVVDKNHPSTKHLPHHWERYDEWYNWKTGLTDNAKVLITVDETTYEGGAHPDFHPISWCQQFENAGRSWYTAMGHLQEHYSDEKFLQHILGGIIWAANGH